MLASVSEPAARRVSVVLVHYRTPGKTLAVVRAIAATAPESERRCR
jgi:hypothetical protein